MTADPEPPDNLARPAPLQEGGDGSSAALTDESAPRAMPADGESPDVEPVELRSSRGRHRRPRPWRFVRLSAEPAMIFTASRLGMLLVAGALAHVQHKAIQLYLTRWDSAWYLAAARTGYPHLIRSGVGKPAQSTLGFFPLLPLVIRVGVDVTGLSYVRVGLVATFIAGLVAAVLIWWLVYPTWGRSGASGGTALVFFSPGAFVLSEVYTEGLLIALVAGVLLALRGRHWLTAGVLAALATATEPLGIAAILPCVVAAVYAIRLRGQWRSLLAPLLSPLGVAAFFCFLWVRTGNPLAWYVTQRRGWQAGGMGSAIYHEVTGLIHTGLSHPDYVVKLSSLFTAIVFMAFFLRRPRDPAALAYVFAVLFLAILSPITGVSWRVLLCAFPLVAVAGARLRGGWFLAALGLSALAMSAIAFVSMGGNSLTP